MKCATTNTTSTTIATLSRPRRPPGSGLSSCLLFVTLVCLLAPPEALRGPSGGGGAFVEFALAEMDANRLYEDLMMTYNRIVRPVKNESDRVVVKVGLKMSQLMEVVSRRAAEANNTTGRECVQGALFEVSAPLTSAQVEASGGLAFGRLDRLRCASSGRPEPSDERKAGAKSIKCDWARESWERRRVCQKSRRSAHLFSSPFFSRPRSLSLPLLAGAPLRGRIRQTLIYILHSPATAGPIETWTVKRPLVACWPLWCRLNQLKSNLTSNCDDKCERASERAASRRARAQVARLRAAEGRHWS